MIEAIAAPEPLAEIRCADPAQLVRVAWHPGNRHLPTQLTGKALRIRRDHVIEEMVRGPAVPASSKSTRRSTPKAAPMPPPKPTRTATTIMTTTTTNAHHDHDHHHGHAL